MWLLEHVFSVLVARQSLSKVRQSVSINPFFVQAIILRETREEHCLKFFLLLHTIPPPVLRNKLRNGQSVS